MAYIGISGQFCEVCGSSITDEFYDAKTKRGPWAIMCPRCFVTHGVGLGTGKGQHYRKVEGEFKKVEG